MNQFHNDINQYSLNAHYNWYHTYYFPQHQYYQYYHPNLSNFNVFTYFSSTQLQNTTHPSPSTSKLIPNLTQQLKIYKQSNNTKVRNKECQEQHKNLLSQNNQIQNQKIYFNPCKFIKQHHIKYFDPSSAPTITSQFYNLIQGNCCDHSRILFINSNHCQQINQLDYPQIDNKPFIVFKFRRIKKKFKKYLTSSHNFLIQQKNKPIYQQYSQSLSSIYQDSLKTNKKIKQCSRQSMINFDKSVNNKIDSPIKKIHPKPQQKHYK